MGGWEVIIGGIFVRDNKKVQIVIVDDLHETNLRRQNHEQTTPTLELDFVDLFRWPNLVHWIPNEEIDIFLGNLPILVDRIIIKIDDDRKTFWRKHFWRTVSSIMTVILLLFGEKKWTSNGKIDHEPVSNSKKISHLIEETFYLAKQVKVVILLFVERNFVHSPKVWKTLNLTNRIINQFSSLFFLFGLFVYLGPKISVIKTGFKTHLKVFFSANFGVIDGLNFVNYFRVKINKQDHDFFPTIFGITGDTTIINPIINLLNLSPKLSPNNRINYQIERTTIRTISRKWTFPNFFTNDKVFDYVDTTIFVRLTTIPIIVNFNLVTPVTGINLLKFKIDLKPKGWWNFVSIVVKLNEKRFDELTFWMINKITWNCHI